MNDDARVPSVLENLPLVRQAIGRRTPVFFLDFDGTLAPISPRPELAHMPPEMKHVLETLSRHHVVCVASGRGLADLVQKVGMRNIYYAADHGYRVLGPEGTGIDFEVATESREKLEAASYAIEQRLRDVPGIVVETKGVSLAVHYRQVAESDRPLVEQVVAEAAGATSGLRLTAGKLVHELVPDAGWDKGKALMWILRRLRYGRKDACPLCLGDDLTDEDMFRATEGWGVSVVVGHPRLHTRADYSLNDWVEVATFLGGFVPEAGDVASSGG